MAWITPDGTHSERTKLWLSLPELKEYLDSIRRPSPMVAPVWHVPGPWIASKSAVRAYLGLTAEKAQHLERMTPEGRERLTPQKALHGVLAKRRRTETVDLTEDDELVETPVKLERVKLGLFGLEPVKRLKLERLELEPDSRSAEVKAELLSQDEPDSMSAEVKAELLSQDEQEISQLLQRIKTEQTEEEEATQPGQSPTPYQSRPSQPDDWYDVLVMTADPEPSGPPVAADPEYGPPGTADPEYGPPGTADEGPSGPPAAQESLDDKIEEFGPSQRSSPPRRYNFNALMGYRPKTSDAETLPYDDQASESLSQGNTFRRFPSF